ncbi:MAG: DNA-processing protein DprA [Propionibacteriaceae bacterium]|nr:DNA-processing protein DprA [Propionibacteriaceae bacterium]
MMTERMARMGLAAAHDAGDLGLAALVRDQGAVDVWESVRSGPGTSSLARRAARVDVDRLARDTQAIGAQFIIPGDEEWPAGVDDLMWSEPVGGVGGPPMGLWVAGPLDLARLEAPVAMVGSRASTTYGEHVSADWAVGLAEQGHAVVSGGAFGIDAAAHRGALAAGGATVAVMASGLAHLYPPGNSSLLEKVRQTGAVVSEYPPDSTPTRSRFLVRNRLIAALSAATVIVEGAMRSGAQNTVSWALSMQRLVMAAPGPVTSAMSVTPHRLIRAGEAVLVTSVEDILQAVGPLTACASDYVRAPPTLFDALTTEQQAIHETLSARRSVSVDELAVRTGESALTLMVVLSQLAARDLAVETAPGLWRAVDHRGQQRGD